MTGKKQILGIFLHDSVVELHCLKKGLGRWTSASTPISVAEARRSGIDELKRTLKSIAPSSTRRIYIGLPRKAFFLREIPMPQLEPQEAENAIRLGIGLHAHLEPEDIYFDIMGFKRDKETRVILTYAPRTLIDPIIRAIEETGHKRSLGTLSPATLGLDMLLRKGLGPSVPCLVIGQQGEDLVLSVHGPEVWEGSHIIRGSDEDSRLERLKEIIAGLPEHMSQAPCYWIGDPESNPGISDRLIRPFGKVRGLESAGLAPTWALFSACIGLTDYPAISMEPGPRKRPLRLRVGAFQLIAGFTAAGCILLTGALGMRYIDLAERKQFQDKKLTELKSRLEPLLKTRAELEATKKRIAHIRQFKADRVKALQIMKVLAEVTPTHTWIKTMSLKGDRLRLSAEGESAVEAMAAWRNSPVFAEVKLVSPVTKNRMQRERFSVEIRLKEQGG